MDRFSQSVDLSSGSANGVKGRQVGNDLADFRVGVVNYNLLLSFLESRWTLTEELLLVRLPSPNDVRLPNHTRTYFSAFRPTRITSLACLAISCAASKPRPPMVVPVTRTLNNVQSASAAAVVKFRLGLLTCFA